jgi:predicted O-methyltransferase YrrM
MDPDAVPERVRRAERAAAQLGFTLGCRPEIGALLRALVATKPAGRIAESGTGTGIGTAWMHSGLGAAATLVTVEIDEERARAAAELFADDPRVTVLPGDWTELAHHGPFDVFFCDGGGKRDDPDAVIELLAPGGTLVLDDFTPSASWPPTFDGSVDELRLTYLKDPRLVATEVDLATGTTAVIGVRRDHPADP